MSELLQSIEPWTAMWGASLWRASWQGTIVLAIAWAMARWCTFLSPRIVCWIWRLACFKLLVTLCWVQPVAIALLPAYRTEAVALQTIARQSVQSVTELETSTFSASSWLVSQPWAPSGGAAFWELLCSLWLLCVLCFVVQTARQWILARRLCRGAELVRSVAWRQVMQQEAERLAVRLLPELRLSSRAEGPLLAGIWRPMIILPAFVEHVFDESELRLMLAHELAHLKR